MIPRMSTQPSIFDKVKLRPAQLRTVADRRFADAAYLRHSNQNQRANGVMYLAGFVVECLLKAALLERFPWLQSAGSPQGRSKNDQYLWLLTYRLHNLPNILAHLPDVERRVEREAGPRLLQGLRSVCESWTIYARY